MTDPHPTDRCPPPDDWFEIAQSILVDPYRIPDVTEPGGDTDELCPATVRTGDQP